LTPSWCRCMFAPLVAEERPSATVAQACLHQQLRKYSTIRHPVGCIMLNLLTQVICV